MVVAQLLPNYHLNHVAQPDLNAVTVTLRVVGAALLHLAKAEMVEKGLCTKVLGLVQVVVTLSPSYRSSQGILPTSSVWTASSKVAKE